MQIGKSCACEGHPKTEAPKRPALRYHGGKWRLAPWIISHFPAHRVYVEPYGGGGSVLLRKARAYAEIYNDLDGEVVNLFRVLQAVDKAAELTRLLGVTPFARQEFLLAFQPSEDDIERARRMLIRAGMGFGSAAAVKDGLRPDGTIAVSTGFRANATRSGSTPAHDWAKYPSILPAITERLHGVTIEHRPAIDVMRAADGTSTLHYADPPYVHSTRAPSYIGAPGTRHSVYRHEMTDEQHEELSEALHGLKGFVVLSGYDCPLYERLYKGWARRTKATHAESARDRTECLWLNPACSAALTGRLDFAEGAA